MLPTFLREFLISNMNLLTAKKSKSFMNNRQIMSCTCLLISENRPLMYIRKRIGDIGDSCGISIFALYLRLMIN